jgi:ATP/maltotriose-dependent transcriptional regulator MalT
MSLARINLAEVFLYRCEYQDGRCEETTFSEAEALLQQSLDLAEEKGHRDRRAYCLAVRGCLETKRGNYSVAYNDLAESLKETRETHNTYLQCVALNYLGELNCARDEPDAASECFAEALTLATEDNYPEYAALALYGTARVALLRGDSRMACRLGQESQQVFERIGHCRAEVIARWLARLPNPHQAASVSADVANPNQMTCEEAGIVQNRCGVSLENETQAGSSFT